jgi:hypothetical protein
MTDNITAKANVGAGTEVFATDEIGGVHFPLTKIAFGVDGAAVHASASNPLPVTGTVAVTGAYQATQPVSNAGTFAVQAAQSGTWNIGSITTLPPLAAGSATIGAVNLAQYTPVSGRLPVDGSGITQPVSAASLPLPSGAATAAKQPALGTAGTASADVITVQGIAGGTAQPISAASLPLPSGAAQDSTLTGGAQQTKITDGTNVATVKAASTAAVAADKAVVVAISPNNTLAATQSGTWNIGSITTLPSLVAGSAVVGKVGIDQTTPGTTNAVSVAQVGSTTVATGNGVVGTGVQRVAIASDNTAFSVNATATGNVAAGVADSGNPVAIGGYAYPTNFTTPTAVTSGQRVKAWYGLYGNAVVTVVDAAGGPIYNAVNGTADAAGDSTSGPAVYARNYYYNGTTYDRVRGDTTSGAWVNVKAVPTLTKGTQGSTGFSTQDLKDAGRAIVNVATAIAGVTCVSTEALLALNVSRDGAATASVTTIAVTSGKRLRITGLVASARSTAATVLSARVALRMNPSGAVTASSPVIAIASLTQQAAALAEAGDTCVVPLDVEFSGTMQIGLSQVCSGTGGVIYASLLGYEY